jgi:hypothetical protein
MLIPGSYTTFDNISLIMDRVEIVVPKSNGEDIFFAGDS